MNKLRLLLSDRRRRVGYLALPFLLLTLSISSQAQTFWRTTQTAPHGPKIGIAATGDSTLITSVADGVLRTTNQGRTWSLALRSHQVYALHASRNGHFLVGGAGKVYRSLDAGATWDSVALATPYPVVSIAETAQGGLLVGTGTADLGGFLGDGVYFSADNGQTWTARNTGMGTGRYISQLTTDRNGRVYAAVSDEDAARLPGLYISDNVGQSWQHVPIRINGRNAIFDDITAYETLALTVSPQDSLLLSFNGVSTNVGVSLNLAKKLTDVPNASQYWTVQLRSQGGMWWNQTPLHHIHIARNGDWYSSRFGSSNSGGTLRSTDLGRTWALVKDGLGLSMAGFREPQQFAEMPDGKIFMVQDMDPQVYWTNASVITAAKPHQRPANLQLYPNPTTEAVRISNGTGQRIQAITLTDLNGRVVRIYRPKQAGEDQTLSLKQEKAGVYIVAVTLADSQVVRQRVVKQ